MNIDYNWTKASDLNPKMEADPYYVKYGPVNFNSGLGLILRYDSRDVPVNPWSGKLIDLQATYYDPSLGGENTFSVFQVDIRKFLKIVRPGSTLALQVKSKVTGSIGPKASEFSYWLPNAGFGYRFEVQPRMNVRDEIGFGKDTRGF